MHHRRSIRLKGYDYSSAGAYFVTICTQSRECLFGEIVVGADLCVCPPADLCVCPPADLCVCPPDLPEIGRTHRFAPTEMVLNDSGQMIVRWFRELGNKFPDIQCDDFICMPNHIHFIVVIGVGADLCVCPPCVYPPKHELGEHNGLGEHIGSPLREVVQWFKTMSTNEYIRGVKQNGWRPFNGKLWQRNYYEHIIRDENELNRIREYIINNPLHWEFDQENPMVKDKKQEIPWQL
ncbi:MAG: transposase [Candidatus Desantisbacteria bacterium]